MQEKVVIDNIYFKENITFGKNDFLLQLHSGETQIQHEEGTVFFFLQQGEAHIETSSMQVQLKLGMYFSLSEKAKVTLLKGAKGVSVHVKNFRSLNSIGGPLETTGRLKYIDGCSDTLLISPSKLGEPCLNLLHFPKNTKQTSHHHPSFRFGMVVSGKGECVSEKGRESLLPGDVFFIPPFVKHNFNTVDESMNVVAFHPDSDWGPTDEVHPMINKTIL